MEPISRSKKTTYAAGNAVLAEVLALVTEAVIVALVAMLFLFSMLVLFIINVMTSTTYTTLALDGLVKGRGHDGSDKGKEGEDGELHGCS